MPLRRLRLPVLLAVLLLGQAVAAPSPLRAAGLPVPSADPGWGGLVLPSEGEIEQRAVSTDLRRPTGPTGSYRPRFVRQTGKNCAFASAAMLIDKWTAGGQRPDQARLRLASRVPSSEGVSFAELSRAVARASGLELRYSPGGGDPLSWDQLMSRLARGGAAVLGGSYSRLPRHYQRWARDFARKGASGSGHAVYIERYEPGRNGGRVWMMDPLARAAGYRGEWISARALRTFAWRNSKGLVTAAATPEPPVLAGYDFAPPQTDEWLLAGGKIQLRLPVAIERGWPKPPALSLVADWQLLTPEPSRESLRAEALDNRAAAGPATAGSQAELEAASQAAIREQQAADLAPPVIGGQGGDDIAASEPVVEAESQQPATVQLNLRDGQLVGTLRAPRQPGLYRLELQLRRADGKLFPPDETPEIPSLTLQLRGELAAELSLLPLLEPPIQGEVARVQFEIVNRGMADWLDGEAVTLRADWQTSIGELPGGGATIDLLAGATGTFTVDTLVPTRVSEGTLHVQLLDRDGVPLAAYGVEPVQFWLRFTSEAVTDATRPTAEPLQ